jgi:methionyl-tRNA formyltransferase
VEGTFQQTVEMAGILDIQCPGVNSFEFTALLNKLKPDVVLVGAWGEILKKHLLEYPGVLFINCHPSKLPAHRGANPYASVLRAGERESGLTFHRVAPRIDAGAILLQQAFPVDPWTDNGMTIRDRSVAVAYQLVKDLMARLAAHILDGWPLEEIEQDLSRHSYYPPLKPEDGLLDWEQPVAALDVQYRSLFPWVACYSFLQGRRTVMFYDPRFLERPAALPADKPAGTILACEKGLITIALSDPKWVMQVSLYQIGGGKAFLPPWLAKWMAPILLRPGRRFMDAV